MGDSENTEGPLNAPTTLAPGAAELDAAGSVLASAANVLIRKLPTTNQPHVLAEAAVKVADSLQALARARADMSRDKLARDRFAKSSRIGSSGGMILP